jgi:predicted nuclease of predicted toxin-antitoxin system
MPRTIKFHLNEHCDPAIAAGLRLQGVDVTTTPKAGLVGATDEQQVAFALSARRVIFTMDSDYLRLNASGTPHAGIAYCHQRTRSIGEIIGGLVLIWEVYDLDEVAYRVEYV